MDRHVIHIIILFALLACKQQNKEIAIPKKEKENLVTEQNKVISSMLLDTVITLPELTRLSSTRKRLTQEKAEIILYKYFKEKGVIPKSDFDPKVYRYDQLCVSYDTSYLFTPNKMAGCVISYWLGPADLNGHCFQPSKALILHTKADYKFSHEDFIPSNFAIDSINATSVYGYEYECGGRGVLRNFRITMR